VRGVRAEGHDRADAETDAGGQGDGHRGVHRGELFDRGAEGREVGRGPAEILGHEQAEQSQRSHLRDDLARELSALVPRAGVRRDLGPCELAHDRPEHVLLRGEVEVHSGQRVRRRRGLVERKQHSRVE